MGPLTFRNEDEEAQYCLSVLRDGTREEKIVARERLAAIFAGRGLYEEAAELYELNVRAGVRSPEIFEQLSETYRHLGEHESAEAALVEARRVRSASRPSTVLSSASSSARPHVPDPATPPPPDPDPRDVLVPGPTAARHDAAEPELSWNGQVAAAEEDSLPHPAGSGVSGPLFVIGSVLFMIVLPVALLALLVINPLGLYLEGRAAGPTVDVSSAEPARLKIAPGASATWYLLTGRSVSGLWATPGLELTLAQPIPQAGGTFSVTAPRSQSWGETITVVERRGQGRANQETIVPATFEAPNALPPVGTVLNGRIAGQVAAPRLTESSQFTTTNQSVDLPVQLVVVSGPELWADRFESSLRMFFDEDRWLLVTIGAILTWCVLAGGAALLFRARHA